MTFGERLIVIRKNKGLTQTQLAKLVNSKQQNVQQWENDEAFPRIDKIIALSNALDVSTDFLLKGDEEEQTIDNIEKEFEGILYKKRVIQQTKETVRAFKKIVDSFNRKVKETSIELEMFLKNEVK